MNPFDTIQRQARRAAIFVAASAQRPKFHRSGIAVNATGAGVGIRRRATATALMSPLRGWLLPGRSCYKDGAPTELSRQRIQ